MSIEYGRCRSNVILKLEQIGRSLSSTRLYGKRSRTGNRSLVLHLEAHVGFEALRDRIPAKKSIWCHKTAEENKRHVLAIDRVVVSIDREVLRVRSSDV